MTQDERADLLGLLIRHEAEGELGPRPRGDDGLAAFFLIAAGESVDLDGGPGAAAFGRGVALFPEQFRHTEEAREGPVVVRGAGELPALIGGERFDVIVEAGHGDASVRIA